jgi:hypothetical protein
LGQGEALDVPRWKFLDPTWMGQYKNARRCRSVLWYLNFDPFPVQYPNGNDMSQKCSTHWGEVESQSPIQIILCPLEKKYGKKNTSCDPEPDTNILTNMLIHPDILLSSDIHYDIHCVYMQYIYIRIIYIYTGYVYINIHNIHIYIYYYIYTYDLTGIYSDIFSGGDICFWHIFWQKHLTPIVLCHTFWHKLWHVLWKNAWHKFWGPGTIEARFRLTQATQLP